jgi:hypothetical protein
LHCEEKFLGWTSYAIEITVISTIGTALITRKAANPIGVIAQGMKNEDGKKGKKKSGSYFNI